jgi:hypothetical protein
MSTFNTFITGLVGQEIYLLLSNKSVKGKITQVNDDLIVFKPETMLVGIGELTLHIHTAVVATA